MPSGISLFFPELSPEEVLGKPRFGPTVDVHFSGSAPGDKLFSFEAHPHWLTTRLSGEVLGLLCFGEPAIEAFGQPFAIRHEFAEGLIVRFVIPGDGDDLHDWASAVRHVEELLSSLARAPAAEAA